MHEQITKQLQQEISASNDQVSNLNNGLRFLAKWRCWLIGNTLVKQEGVTVKQGPMEGLDFLEKSQEGCHVPKLIGTYEQPLHPYLSKVIAGSYSVIINIGCAEGYYVAGLARRMPNTSVIAYDIDQKSREACLKLCEKNGVSHQVQVKGIFSTEELKQFVGEKVLILCDIEGAELDILVTDEDSPLNDMDVIVESHECIHAGITNILIERFKMSHEIEIVQDTGLRTIQKPPQWFLNLSHLDQILATWEWRSGPTPWLVMHAKSQIT